MLNESSGASIAAPRASGAMALLRSTHPEATVTGTDDSRLIRAKIAR